MQPALQQRRNTDELRMNIYPQVNGVQLCYVCDIPPDNYWGSDWNMHSSYQLKMFRKTVKLLVGITKN